MYVCFCVQIEIGHLTYIWTVPHGAPPDEKSSTYDKPNSLKSHISSIDAYVIYYYYFGHHHYMV